MEQTPEVQPQPQEPRTWKVGDLYQFPAGLILCIGASHTFAYFVTAERMPLADVQIVDAPKDAWFLHNTGLRYTYTSREQLSRYLAAGFFTPYFEIP